MYKKISLFIFLLCFNNIATSQDFWERAWPDSLIGQFINVRSLAINSQGHIFAGTIGEYILRSTDNGDNWTQLTNGFSSDKIFGLAINDSDHIFGATFEFGGFYRSTDNGESWQVINQGLPNGSVFGTTLVIDDSGHIFGGTWGDGIFRSTDNGDNWEQKNNGLDHPFSVHLLSLVINNTGQIFAGTANGIYRSDDNGDNWQEMNQGLTTKYVWSIAINPDDCLFVTTWGNDTGDIPGNIFRSCNNGENWEEANGDLTEQYPRPIISNNSGYLFVGYRKGIDNGGVFESQDNGQSWHLTGLKGDEIQSFALNDSGQLFAGTWNGIYRSQRSTTDTTDTTIGIEQIVIEIIPKEFVLKQNYPNPFNPNTVIEYEIPNRSDVKLIIYNLRGEVVALLFNGTMPAGNHQVSWDASNFASGIYFYRLQAGEFVQTRKMLLIR